MKKRKKLGPEIEAQVVVQSKRRCCLCWALERNQSVQAGQIAHLDRDPSNSDFDNLVWLCLKHHDEYDSRTSQSKGLTELEVKIHRDELHKFISQEYGSRPFYSLDGKFQVRRKRGTKTITFAVAFPATPHVLVSPISKKPCMYALNDISSTGFTVDFETEQNHDEVSFNWVAFLDSN